VGGLRRSVFPDPKEEEEGDGDEVGDGVQMWGPPVVCRYRRDGRYRQGKLRLCGGIAVAEGLDQARDGEVKELLGGGCSSGVRTSVQNILLRDVPESPFDRLNLDLISKAVLSFPHGNSKRE
jgi:hypothetical protein